MQVGRKGANLWFLIIKEEGIRGWLSKNMFSQAHHFDDVIAADTTPNTLRKRLKNQWGLKTKDQGINDHERDMNKLLT